MSSLRLQYNFVFQENIHSLILDSKVFQLELRAGLYLLNSVPYCSYHLASAHTASSPVPGTR